mmetsp:Transcript_17907/g.49659  ORF Transcript_17907/g.49659 Transcript_17907/m.49659 type:complete len:280 (-) Transcript_17907:84-923(-)
MLQRLMQRVGTIIGMLISVAAIIAIVGQVQGLGVALILIEQLPLAVEDEVLPRHAGLARDPMQHVLQGVVAVKVARQIFGGTVGQGILIDAVEVDEDGRSQPAIVRGQRRNLLQVTGTGRTFLWRRRIGKYGADLFRELQRTLGLAVDSGFHLALSQRQRAHVHGGGVVELQLKAVALYHLVVHRREKVHGARCGDELLDGGQRTVDGPVLAVLGILPHALDGLVERIDGVGVLLQAVRAAEDALLLGLLLHGRRDLHGRVRLLHFGDGRSEVVAVRCC